ncbi:hypothetical protein BC629DRAFT_1654462 [Irpex lacteus]|nr:hypothetical protein BC629DRAFT_1654462 [Irpex lacteus]
MSSKAIKIGRDWPGLQNIKHLIVFGDSYSSVKLGANVLPRPTETNRLGVSPPFPGITWNEEGKPNWVGHFLSKPGVNSSLLVYDYAVGGHTVSQMRSQVLGQFMKMCEEQGPLCTNESLFVTWIGINDLGYASFNSKKRSLETLFELQEVLYTQGGARNFLFIDVPPIDRSPVFVSQYTRTAPSPEHYQTWNTALHNSISTFAAAHPDTTTLLFSSYDLFTRILDEPGKYGFDERTAHVAGGCFWYDHLHPTSQVHDAIATEVARFLASRAPLSGPSSTGTNTDSEGAVKNASVG